MTVKFNLFLDTDDTCLIIQSDNVKNIEKQLNKVFANICDWFVDNKLFIRTLDMIKSNLCKSVLFTSKLNIKKVPKLDIIYNNIRIKQYSRVTYLTKQYLGSLGP